ncbi:hypothetical protein GR160_18185 [Flavobacterium sp. Sd200]|uniref:hypothetical protein n=1 Tax=Flavobacterium sp. Sd200 TaxID=2692211 RepID=UPI00136A7758|nr:hypothetical protein [Flavobacterium sp. Sd200]MXN93161.1 hypothetical protein [Flavobacterium sp. Sd200]
MNRDLEKLVEYALADGYISDKERQVLFKKAADAGFDTDELEIILNGKLHEISQANTPKINKCPSCGEIMSGLSKVCPSCNYITTSEPINDNESLQDGLKKLEDSIYALKTFPKPGASSVFNSVVLIVITGGFYIIYKKLIKKENLFDRYALINEKTTTIIERQVNNLKTKYGNDQDINGYIDKLILERNNIISRRQKSDLISAIGIFVSIGVVLYLFSLVPAPDPNKKEEESAEDKTERHIKSGRIGAAKLSVANVEDSAEKDAFLFQIRDMEIDSLANAGSYNEALLLARTIKNSDDISRDMEHKVDGIIEKQVNHLINLKEFQRARECAELSSYYKSGYLKTSIDIEEHVAKEEAQKEKQKNKASKKKRK